MIFVTYDELIRDAQSLAARMPPDTIGVLGVPRSGLMVAGMMAMTRHVHLGDIQTFANTGKFTSPGRRMTVAGPSPYRGTICVVDDSAYSGKAMRDARAGMERSPYYAHHDWKFVVVYGSEKAKYSYDDCIKPINEARRFEWNFMNRGDITDAIVDIDGVLCEDPPAKLEDNYDRYREWVATAPPKNIPYYEIGTLVTMRLGLYREETESWLERWGIRYKRLMMCDARTPHKRRKEWDYGKWKGDQAVRVKATWGIESCPKQAQRIAEVAGIPVVCTVERRVYE